MARKYEFTDGVAIAAEAVGQPGQRRFRIQAADANGASATVWLEKEQLSALGEAIETVLREEGYEHLQLPPDDRPPPPVFPLSADVEFRGAQLSMGVNRDRKRLVLIATDGEDDGMALTVEVDYGRGFELHGEIREVVAAGRPPCPLCGGPMDPAGHICPRSNGHQPH